MDGPPYDLLVIGGGINGAGIARDASGRGLRVLLAEKGDLAEATSSSSTKLIHGGLRYLEYGEFRLVREALAERERLLAIAPHIIWPLRFVLPHTREQRPRWMLRAGLFLYDHLARLRTLPKSRALRLTDGAFGAPLREGLTDGFAYSDCWVEDSRLVVLNALDAAARGAEIRTRTRVESARRDATGWIAELRGAEGPTRVRAAAIVNAAGPWVGETLREALGIDAPARTRLVKGSHIVVRRLYEGSHAYILQNPDGRIIFAIPYEREFTLIGTTDVPYDARASAEVRISPEETAYLCDSINRYFRRPIAPGDVVWSYSGVRPLYDETAAAVGKKKSASAVTRDYVLDISGGDGAPGGGGAPGGDGAAPVLTVYGGKITTYRRLAEHALEKLMPFLPGLAGRADLGPKGSWTAGAPLPGGEMVDFGAFLADFRARRPFLPEATALRLARDYGTRADVILGPARCLEDLGRDFGAGLTGAEVDYLVAAEWAQTAADVLWRRSKLGLHLGEGGAAALAAYLARCEEAA